MRRIVITGAGLVSPLGCGTDLVWKRLLDGRSGIRRLPDNLVADLPAQIAGAVPNAEEDAEGGFEPTRVVNAKDEKRMDRFIQFALGAADEAIAQSGWAPETDAEHDRSATIIGSGIGGFATMQGAVRTIDQRGPRKLSPFTVPSFLANLAAGQISIRHGFRGPIGTPVTACAASLQAIGDGMRMIRAGEVDVAVCGGAESCIDRVSLGSFAAARALSTGYNDTPERASRPVDAGRDGFVLSEGAAVVVVEALDHALARGATPIAEVIGYGTTSDAYHMAAAPEDGVGLQRCMRLAIENSGIRAADIGYVNAHATSTEMGDAAELTAIRGVFNGTSPAVSSTKSATGHLLGAAGATGFIFTVRALQTGILPPTINLEELDERFRDMDVIGPKPRARPIDYAMTNAFGFGGVNASVLSKRWTA
jgi:3-oxoacyl-[acyl-carrier-protein] synthase II